MSAVIYEASGAVAALALPVQRARVIETPAVYQDQIIPAVTEERDGETVEIEPERTESVLVSDAVWRDETTEEMVARLIAAGYMPGLPWTRHMIVDDTPPGAPGAHWAVDWQTGTVTMLPPPLPTAEDYGRAVQAAIDAAAKSRGYTDGFALASYHASTVPAWAAEAQAFVAWRDAVWVHAYDVLAAVQGGTRAPPTIVALISELPIIIWP